NYIRSFDPLYLEILWKSVWLSVLTTALCLVTAYPVAFGICFAPERWKPLLLLSVILPFWINLLIRTYALIAVFRTQGYINLTVGNVIERQFKAANDWPFGSAISFLLMYVTFGALALRALIAGRSKGVDV